MHLNSELLFEKYATSLFRDNIRVLEIGPSDQPSPFCQLINNPAITWETLDISSALKPTYVATNDYHFPIPDNTFDIIVSAQVIEHVKKIWLWIKEVTRVCKTGGNVITIAPVSWPFHEYPVDCWRIYADGMKALYEEANLRVEVCRTETLEKLPHRRVLPGAGAGRTSKEFFLRRLAKDVVRWPTTCSYDTIAIGTKTTNK
jgi:ubiquinone/menaquinone biosynthesis C-methylase UbiE